MSIFHNYLKEEKKELTLEEKIDFLYKKAIIDEIRRKRRIYYKIMILLLLLGYIYYFLLVALPSLTSGLIGGEKNNVNIVETFKNLLNK